MNRLGRNALIVFIVAYVILGVVYQMNGSKSPTSENTPLEFFTRGLLWMLSLTSLLIAVRQTKSWRIVFWMLGCLALAMLAIDERFEYHEQTGRRGWFDDDYFKIVSWVGSAAVLVTIHRMHRPGMLVTIAFAIGYAFHSLYILVETGDGEFFKLPAEKRTLRDIEEYSELFFLASYLLGFQLIHLRETAR